MSYTVKTVAFFFILSSCSNSIRINNITQAPIIQPEDTKYAHVYKTLDGTWKGEFKILEDENRIAIDQLDLSILSKEFLDNRNLKLYKTINVTQSYTSISPYFQNVAISDEDTATGKIEKSHGVNKIQNGEMWCVVRKPSETVIHQGHSPNDSTIIWQSDQASPFKKEYFYEIMTSNHYEIIGFGYYGDDDINLSPRLWFYGIYKKQGLL